MRESSAMPIAKYFATVGSALVAMLFVANWYFPEPPVAFPDQPIEKTTIRIKSARKWPEKIVFNTSQPMPLVGDIPAAEQLAPPVPDDDTGRSAVEALAQLKQLPRLTSASRVRAAHKVARGHRSTNVVVLPNAWTARGQAGHLKGGAFQWVQIPQSLQPEAIGAVVPTGNVAEGPRRSRPRRRR